MHLVVCLGASIMRGRFGTDFVELLGQRMSKDGFGFVNSGVNGDLAYNVLARLDAVIARQPDYVVILVGTNDITAALYPRSARMFLSRLTRRLPRPPSTEWYHDNVLQIVRLLKDKTTARIALASLTVLGEDLTSLPNERVRAYNALLKEEYLSTAQHTKGRPFEPRGMLALELFVRHYLMWQSFDEISKKNGFLLVTDGIHMNSRGAAIIADQIESFLRASE